MHWLPGRRAPGYNEQCAQLTAARVDNDWLAAGSQTAQQQAMRDFAQARCNFFAGTHRQPTWRNRVTCDRAGCWHVAFAHIPDPITGLNNGSVVGIDRGVGGRVTGELLRAPSLTPGESKLLKVLQQPLARSARLAATSSHEAGDRKTERREKDRCKD